MDGETDPYVDFLRDMGVDPDLWADGNAERNPRNNLLFRRWRAIGPGFYWEADPVKSDDGQWWVTYRLMSGNPYGIKPEKE